MLLRDWFCEEEDDLGKLGKVFEILWLHEFEDLADDLVGKVGSECHS